MLTSSAGIGYLVTLNRTILDSPRVFAAILVILVLSIAYYMLARALERRMVVWQIRRPAAERGARATRRPPCPQPPPPERSTACKEQHAMTHAPACPPPSSAATRSPTGW